MTHHYRRILDPYATLGVGRDAGDAELRAAYYNRLRHHHQQRQRQHPAVSEKKEKKNILHTDDFFDQYHEYEASYRLLRDDGKRRAFDALFPPPPADGRVAAERVRRVEVDKAGKEENENEKKGNEKVEDRGKVREDRGKVREDRGKVREDRGKARDRGKAERCISKVLPPLPLGIVQRGQRRYHGQSPQPPQPQPPQPPSSSSHELASHRRHGPSPSTPSSSNTPKPHEAFFVVASLAVGDAPPNGNAGANLAPAGQGISNAARPFRHLHPRDKAIHGHGGTTCSSRARQALGCMTSLFRYGAE